MMGIDRLLKVVFFFTLSVVMTVLGTSYFSWGEDKKSNTPLRHIAIPYANFNTGYGTGFDVEIVKLFAEKIGRPYEYVETSWEKVISDLIGKEISVTGNDVTLGKDAPVRGDIICTGFTVLPWREKILAFSTPTFPTQVWVVTSSKSPLVPINPSGSLEKDIEATKEAIKGRTVMGIKGICVDPVIYGIDKIANVKYFGGSLNDLAGVVIKGEVETIILDAPDTFIALQKWPGQIKIIGPVSEKQSMACAFRKEDKELLQSFNQFLKEIQENGLYMQLVEKYYPAAPVYFPEFFQGLQRKAKDEVQK